MGNVAVVAPGVVIVAIVLLPVALVKPVFVVMSIVTIMPGMPGIAISMEN
jgi:hypothetical protein